MQDIWYAVITLREQMRSEITTVTVNKKLIYRRERKRTMLSDTEYFAKSLKWFEVTPWSTVPWSPY